MVDFFRHAFYGIRFSGQTGASNDGAFIGEDSIMAKSAVASTSYGVVATDATAVVGTTQQFRLYSTKDYTAALRLRVRLELEIITASAGSPLGRVNVYLRDTGGDLTNAKYATPVSLSAISGTRYEFLVGLDCVQRPWTKGAYVEIRFELEITTASGSGGSTCEVKLNHDPASKGRELILEIDS